MKPSSPHEPSNKQVRKVTRARQREARKVARGQMTLIQHLSELKGRFFKAAIGIALGAIGGWFLFDPAFAAIQQPLLDAAAATGKPITINFGGAATALDMRIKMSFFIGMVVTSPWWILQLWGFINPGLSRTERRYSYGFVGAAVPLFLAGTYLAWWILPHAVNILTTFVPENATNLQDGQVYLSFVMRLMLAFGLAFISPVVLVAVNFLGFVSASDLLKGWRWGIMIAVIFAAVMTPTGDAVTMIWVSIPIIVLFFAAVGVAFLHDRRVAKDLTDFEAVLG